MSGLTAERYLHASAVCQATLQAFINIHLTGHG